MATPDVRGVKHGLAVHRVQDQDGSSFIRIDEYKDGQIVADQWIMKTLNGAFQPGEVAEKRRRAAFDDADDGHRVGRPFFGRVQGHLRRGAGAAQAAVVVRWRARACVFSF